MAIDEQQNNEDKNEMTGRRVKLIVLGLIISVVAVALVFLPVTAYLPAVLKWTENLGIWAPVAIVVLYIIACVFFIPGSIITLGAGLLFGVVKGTIVVSIGSVLGAAAAFLVGRTLLRGWVEKKVVHNAKFNAIDKAVGEQGFKIVLLTRLSPVIPFNLLNYAFGLTRVTLRHYFFGSWIGMFPATVMYVYFGSALRSLTDLTSGSIEGGGHRQVFFWVGLAATILVVIIVTRIATRAFKEAVK